MKLPRSAVGRSALFLVVLTVGLTSPLLAMLSTLLLPRAAADPVLSSQIISLLAGKWGGPILQTEVAVSASALLVFASNTAIIGSYHVFLALSRMSFFPDWLLKRNKLRDTPHFSIGLAVNEAVIDAALNAPDKKPVVFLYLGKDVLMRPPKLFRLIEPHLNDQQAREVLARVNALAEAKHIQCRFIYRYKDHEVVYHLWQSLHPAEIIVSQQQAAMLNAVPSPHAESIAGVSGDQNIYLLKT
jgi:hypothetical protein